MKKEKLTVQEAAERLLMSQSSIYSWIEKGKFETEDLPSGRVIVISDNEIEEIKNSNLKSKRNKVSKQQYTNFDNLQENQVIDAEFSSTEDGTLRNINVNMLKEITDTIKDLALKAGKTELLEVQREENKSEAVMWRDKFFEEQANNKLQEREIADLKSSVEEKEQKIKELEAEIESLKASHRKPFGLFNKKLF